MRNDQLTIELCISALHSVRASISDEIAQEIERYITTYNEWGLGIENLIDELIEQDIRILPFQYDSISIAMNAMELSQSTRLIDLRSQVVTP